MPDEEAAALADHATPLAALPDGELPARLADDLAAADAGGRGEVTPGTRECFRSKARVVRHLVAEQGFRTVAFEAGVTESLALDAAVRGDPHGSETPPSPEEALASLSLWPFRVEAVHDLLAWLRAFNADRPADDRVRVRGLDLRNPADPAGALVDRLRAVDAVPVPNELAALADAGSPPGDDAARERHLNRAEAVAATVANRLDDGREAFAAAAAPGEWALARHLCGQVRRACEWHRVRHETAGPNEAGMAARDRLMAETAEWCLDHDPGTGVILWAHNTHVQRGCFDDGTVWTDGTAMGDHLDDALGDAYRVVGFDVGCGTVRAQQRGAGGDPATVELDDPMAGTLTEALADTAAADAGPAGAFAVDLDTGAEDPRLDAHLNGEGCIRWVGSVFDPDADAGHHYQATDLPGSYDWLWFLPESTPSRPLDGG